MNDQRDVEAITQRLRVALEALESAVERRLEVAVGDGEVADQIHALSLDRSKLASELDAAAARSKSLENTNREIAERIEVAMGAIRSVIAVNER
ncbi:MAG TPA: DUF4164 family protein [Vicinamibacterales bacterium]|jgi:hypothetical protein|nr:DUF4164 family protein [Vicinamibacterales bacterium]